MKNIFRKRTPLFLCTLFLCIFLPAILLCSHCFDRALFHKITSAYVQSSLEHDALSLHFVMAYPNLQGIHLKDAALPVYSKEASEASAASRQKFLSVLSFLDSKKLKEEERYTYDLLCDRLALDLEESDFSYYEEPLSPTSGMQSELLLLFAEYPFYTADDVETYLSLLQSVPDYVQGLLSYESEKSAAGLFMEKEDAKKSAQQRREILDREEVDEQLCDARLFIDSARRRVRPRLEDRGIEAHRKEHDDCGDKARDDEDQKRRAHDPPRALRAFHAGDGATQRAEHERHDDAEHQVNEDRAERGETCRPRPQRAQHASEYDGEQHRAQKAVGAEKGTRHRIPPLKIAFNTI